jgi:hypothetical protein
MSFTPSSRLRTCTLCIELSYPCGPCAEWCGRGAIAYQSPMIVPAADETKGRWIACVEDVVSLAREIMPSSLPLSLQLTDSYRGVIPVSPIPCRSQSRKVLFWTLRESDLAGLGPTGSGTHGYVTVIANVLGRYVDLETLGYQELERVCWQFRANSFTVMLRLGRVKGSLAEPRLLHTTPALVRDGGAAQ